MKITDLDKMKIEEQKKAVRSGYDMEIIPSDLATYGGEAKRLLQDLQTRNERMFLVTILIMNTAASRQKLENAIFQTASIAQKYNCALKRLDFQQEAVSYTHLDVYKRQVIPSSFCKSNPVRKEVETGSNTYFSGVPP